MNRPVKIIFDTDLDTDCDDAGALAILHVLADRGEVEILAVVCDVPVESCPACARAINEWYGREGIPVGAVLEPAWRQNPRYAAYRDLRDRVVRERNMPLYNDVLGGEWLARHGPWQAEEAVRLYRKTLASQDDGSAVICVVGLLEALARLLQSGPDDLSPLDGSELIRRKVRQLVTMAGGGFPQGKDSFNWGMDRHSSEYVLNNWPAPLAVSSWGSTVRTGKRLMSQAPPQNPIRRSFEIFLAGKSPDRQSWDQLAALYAAQGTAGRFQEGRGHAVSYSAQTGENYWSPDPVGKGHVYLYPTVGDDELTQQIEDLMLVPPAGGRE
jgi:inosine-uridine nucleoside N-ribohydrolase